MEPDTLPSDIMRTMKFVCRLLHIMKLKNLQSKMTGMVKRIKIIKLQLI